MIYIYTGIGSALGLVVSIIFLEFGVFDNIYNSINKFKEKNKNQESDSGIVYLIILIAVIISLFIIETS